MIPSSLRVFRELSILCLLLLGSLSSAADEHDHAQPGSTKGEEIRSLRVTYDFPPDGSIRFEQRFLLNVTGGSIQRGPILTYLTVFQGSGGLVLDSDFLVDEVMRDGKPESFLIEQAQGSVRLLIGSKDRLLEHRVHEYVVRGSMRGDWRRERSSLSTTLDIVGSLPALSIHETEVIIHFPKGVNQLLHSVSLSGATRAEDEANHPSPADYDAKLTGRQLIIRPSAPFGVDRHFYLTLAWPSSGFPVENQWQQILRQHSLLLLSTFSAAVLLLFLFWLLRRALSR